MASFSSTRVFDHYEREYHRLTKAAMKDVDLIDQLLPGAEVTRARICDTEAIRRRVMADELSLAADVWDVEPLPIDDPLLGRHNVVHTPHNAGRTIDANEQWTEKLVVQFKPR